MLKYLLIAMIPILIGFVFSFFRTADSRVHKISVEEARQKMAAGGVIVVDVREADEFSAGHIAGAVNLPLSALESRAPHVLPDKKVPLLLYCQSGHRSADAAKQLAGLGYQDISDFGGLNRWSYGLES